MISEPTSDHAAIQFWAKVHGAHPAERLPEIVDSVQPVLCFVFHRSSRNIGRVIPIRGRCSLNASTSSVFPLSETWTQLPCRWPTKSFTA